jgi:hypothetical protein
MAQGKSHYPVDEGKYQKWVQIRQAQKKECTQVKGHMCYPGSDRLCKVCYSNEMKDRQ